MEPTQHQKVCCAAEAMTRQNGWNKRSKQGLPEEKKVRIKEGADAANCLNRTALQPTKSREETCIQNNHLAHAYLCEHLRKAEAQTDMFAVDRMKFTFARRCHGWQRNLGSHEKALSSITACKAQAMPTST